MSTFDPTSVDLTAADPTSVICYLGASNGPAESSSIGARVSAIFVILIASTGATMIPVMLARRSSSSSTTTTTKDSQHRRWWLGSVTSASAKVYAFLFARNFGAGVILATALIHLLDPAYAAVGPQSCVGMTGVWASYSWVPGMALAAVLATFVLDLGAQQYVEVVYGDAGDHERGQLDAEAAVVADGGQAIKETACGNGDGVASERIDDACVAHGSDSHDPKISLTRKRAVKQQMVAFLVLEFGVIFHSVIIGLTLGSAGSEFGVLYPVIVFHQSFEGLGIGARLSTIPFRQRNWLPWLLCLAYGLTTPIAIAIGLGVRDTYDGKSFVANVVSGVLNATSAGILIYTALVELLARDFFFDPQRTKDSGRLAFMVGCVLLGAGLMALLGKWA